MTCGLALAVTRVGGNSESIQDGVNGLLVPPGDSSALTAALRRLHDDPVFAHILSGNARRSTVERYSLEGEAD